MTRPVFENIFISRSFWLVTDNYLYKVFTSFLAKLFVTGQYDRWNDYCRSERIRLRSELLRRETWHLRNSTELSKFNENVIPKEVFASILIHYCICIGACAVSFVGEKFRHFIQARKIKFIQGF